MADDAILSLADLCTAFEARLVAAPDLGIHVLSYTLDTPTDYPAANAHKGVAIKAVNERNTGMTRNRDVARLRTIVVVTLTHAMTADAKASRTAALNLGAAIMKRITTLTWSPGGGVNQISYVGGDFDYHPRGRDWYVIALSFQIDYDTALGDGT